MAAEATERNHEIASEQPLLNDQGLIAEPGWARKPFWIYDRDAITAPWHRIKEWDYYVIWGDGVALALTLSDIAFLGVHSISFFDLNDAAPWVKTSSAISVMPNGSMGFASRSDLNNAVSYHGLGFAMDFIVLDGERHLFCSCARFRKGQPLLADIRLYDEPGDALVVATPWPKPRHFYYNQKINCLRAEGFIQLGQRRYNLDPSRHFATLDWGRGAWTHDNIWWWSSGNGLVDGRVFGFNLGYGFADTRAASENIFFLDGRGHKLDDVTFTLSDPNDYEAPWTVSSSDGRFEALFTPIIDRSGGFTVGFAGTDQHQVMGRMSGTAVTDDGARVVFESIPSFIERVRMTY